MKVFITIIFAFLLLTGFVAAQDTLYMYKAGLVISKRAVVDIDSVTFEKNYTQITAPTGTMSDIDGNVYKWITFGTQTWMVENLKVSKYRTGESISNTTDATLWSNATYGAWCNYDNNAANGDKYGKLYNWYAVNDSRKIAPIGWHISTEAEWTILVNYLIANGFNYDGTYEYNRLGKSLAAQTDWNDNTNEGSIGNDLSKNNRTGFTGLPSGVRDEKGVFNNIGAWSFWWTSTIGNSATNACFSYMLNGGAYSGAYKDGKIHIGAAIRCIKD